MDMKKEEMYSLVRFIHFVYQKSLGNFANLYDYGIKLPIKVLPSKLDKKIYESVLKDLGIRKFNKTEVDKERSLHIPV